MKKTAPKKIRNSTLVILFSGLVLFAIIISIIVRIIILISQSTFDNYHQFILEVKEQSQHVDIIAFNPTVATISVLHINGVKNNNDINMLQIPIEAQFNVGNANAATLPLLLFTMMFHCNNLTCRHVNVIDAIKLYIFSKTIHPNAIDTANISIPPSQRDLTTTIPSFFTDVTLYQEGLSISIVNASGEAGLGTTISNFLTTIGANVISVTSGNEQSNTTMQSTYGNTNYTVQRLQQILHIKSQKMHNTGISDIIITIGKKNPKI